MTGLARLSRNTLICLGIVLSVVACRQEEQDRILLYDKGKYMGPADTELTDEQNAALRDRARRQGF